MLRISLWFLLIRLRRWWFLLCFRLLLRRLWLSITCKDVCIKVLLLNVALALKAELGFRAALINVLFISWVRNLNFTILTQNRSFWTLRSMRFLLAYFHILLAILASNFFVKRIVMSFNLSFINKLIAFITLYTISSAIGFMQI